MKNETQKKIVSLASIHSPGMNKHCKQLLGGIREAKVLDKQSNIQHTSSLAH